MTNRLDTQGCNHCVRYGRPQRDVMTDKGYHLIDLPGLGRRAVKCGEALPVIHVPEVTQFEGSATLTCKCGESISVGWLLGVGGEAVREETCFECGQKYEATVRLTTIDRTLIPGEPA